MKILTNSLGIETKIFAKTVESDAIEQIKNLMEYPPYSKEKIRIMPDVHLGKGCTIGTTMTISDSLTPNLVGVDIGCGMLTIKLKNQKINYKKLDSIIRMNVPHGFNIHSSQAADFDFSNIRATRNIDIERAKLSIGSLGGGNHFIEIGESDKGNLYLIIHSGSRKLGTDICSYYQKLALEQLTEKYLEENKDEILNKKGKKRKRLSIPNRDLAHLTGKDFDDYMNDMQIVQKYASLNRATMAQIIIDKYGFEELDRFETIHNYIDFEKMILRKGAVSAQKGEKLLIPFNMRDGSLICVGKGNADWNYSAPHGAGRLMSRTQARRELDMDEFKNSMKDIFTTSLKKSIIDEAPKAYKPMDEIINAIGDTAEIVEKIKPLYNFKAE